jgi:opacity protein-like surface antigen
MTQRKGHMLALKNALLGFAAFSSGAVFSGTMGPVDSNELNPSVYIKLGSGGSYSMNADIFADPAFWDASPQGYNGNIGHTAIYSAALGYNYSPLISGDIEYIYRPSYSYSKYQTSTATGTVDFNGDKTRRFDLQSNSLMANLYLHGAALSDSLHVDLWNTYTLEPFVGGGLGVSFNDVMRFYSIRTDGVYTAIEPGNFRTSLAWQFSAGLQLMNQRNFNLAAGYRYYHGGTFSSSNFVILSQVYAAPWKGTVQANEFFVTVAYKGVPFFD